MEVLGLRRDEVFLSDPYFDHILELLLEIHILLSKLNENSAKNKKITISLPKNEIIVNKYGCIS